MITHMKTNTKMNTMTKMMRMTIQVKQNYSRLTITTKKLSLIRVKRIKKRRVRSLGVLYLMEIKDLKN